jgi:hypothetical protein
VLLRVSWLQRDLSLSLSGYATLYVRVEVLLGVTGMTPYGLVTYIPTFGKNWLQVGTLSCFVPESCFSVSIGPNYH